MIHSLSFIVHAFFLNKGNSLFSLLAILAAVMIIDFITDMLASKKEGSEHPNNIRYGWNKKKRIKEIYKKAGYLIIVLVATITDYLINLLSNETLLKTDTQTLFGVLVSIWLIINELISILENTRRMGSQLPKQLKKVLLEIKKSIDNTKQK